MSAASYIDQDDAWQNMLDHLYLVLQEMLGLETSANFEALFDELETWLPFVNKPKTFNEPEFKKRSQQWNIARSLVWCAQQATRSGELRYDEIDRSIFALQSTPSYIRQHKSWAWNCIHLWLRTPIQQRDRPIPIAITDELGNVGVVVTLVLEVLEGGTEQVFHHPKDALRTYVRHDFEEAIAEAWREARKLVRQQVDNEQLYDGRWHVLGPDGKPYHEVAGRSASAAAAWGWWFVLQDKIPDDGIIILAQLDDQGMFSGVSGVTAKVEAIVEDGRFDTIVVANKENLKEAQRTLKALDKSRAIRVKKLDV